MSIPYLPLFVADYELDTAHLSFEENGVYMRLLMLCWRTPDCSIPNDPDWIAKRLRVDMSVFEKSVRPVLEEFFKMSKGRLFNSRLLEEWSRIKSTSTRRVNAGKKGGRPTNILSDKEKTQSPAFENGKQKESPALHLDLNPDLDKKDTSLRSVAPSAPKPSEQMVELRKVLDEEHAKAVIDHRKGFKGRFTARAAILLASKFGRCPDANAAADAMISNNWMGFEPEWLENRKASARASPAVPLRGLAAIEERLKRDIENEQRINSTPSHDGEIDAGFPFLAIADHRGHY